MPSLREGGLRFDFPDPWEATQYDNWAFYRNQFAAIGGGSRAVDFLACHPQQDSLWLIEVKDYRRNPRTKPIHLWEEMAVKVRDTLAGLVAAKSGEADPDRSWAEYALRKPKLRVVLHLEQPAKPSRLFPRSFDPAKVQQKLRQVIKPIDAHARVTDSGGMGHVPWETTPIPCDEHELLKEAKAP